MTEKRYFKKEWEEEYYIFDSENISEKDFEEKYDYEDYRAFEDSMMGDEVVNRLNEQHETIQVLKASNGEMEDYLARLEEENEQLKQQLEDCRFALRTELAHQRVEKEEHSDTVYDFKKKIEKW